MFSLRHATDTTAKVLAERELLSERIGYEQSRLDLARRHLSTRDRVLKERITELEKRIELKRSQLIIALNEHFQTVDRAVENIKARSRLPAEEREREIDARMAELEGMKHALEVDPESAGQIWEDIEDRFTDGSVRRLMSEYPLDSICMHSINEYLTSELYLQGRSGSAFSSPPSTFSESSAPISESTKPEKSERHYHLRLRMHDADVSPCMSTKIPGKRQKSSKRHRSLHDRSRRHKQDRERSRRSSGRSQRHKRPSEIKHRSNWSDTMVRDLVDSYADLEKHLRRLESSQHRIVSRIGINPPIDSSQTAHQVRTCASEQKFDQILSEYSQLETGPLKSAPTPAKMTPLVPSIHSVPTQKDIDAVVKVRSPRPDPLLQSKIDAVQHSTDELGNVLAKL